MKFVVAENFNCFKQYYPEPKHDIAYLHNIMQLKGRINYEVEYLGRWWYLDSEFLKQIEIEQKLNNIKDK